MTDQIDLTHVNGRQVPEWALESTLTECADYLRAMSNFAEKDFQDDKKDDKHTDKHRKILEKNLKELSQNSKGLGFSGFQKQMIDAFAAGGGAAYERVLRRTFGGALKMGGLFGAVLVGMYEGVLKLKDVIIDTHRAYLAVYDSGMSLNGSFVDLIDSAAIAHMSVDDFSSAMTQYSRVIHNMSSTASRGAETWGRLNNQVRQLITQGNMGMLGMTMSDVNDYMSEYLEIQQLRGTNEQFDEARRSSGIANYLIQLTRLSQITGIHRKQLQDQLMEAQREDRWVAFLAAQEKPIADQLGSMLNHFAALGPEVATLWKDMVMGVYSPSSKALMSTTGDIGQQMQAMADAARQGASFTNKQMDSFVFDMRKWVDNLDPKSLEAFSQAAATGSSEVAATFIGFVNSMRKVAKDDKNIRTEYSDTLTSLLAQWEDIRARLMTPFLKIFGDFLRGLNTGGGVLDQFASVIREASAGITSFLEGITKTEKFEEVIKDLSVFLGDAVKAIKQFVIDLMSPEGREKIQQQLSDGLSNIISYIGEAIAQGISNWFWGKNEDEEQSRPRGRGQGIRPKNRDFFGNPIDPSKQYAKGGIASTPAIFGEKGPEAAIPLTGGRKIPIAEIKGDFNKNEMKEMIRLLQSLGNKLDMQTELSKNLITGMSKMTSAYNKQSGIIF